MHDYTEYFAHRLKRMATEVDYIALIVVSGFYANKLPGTDIVLYRWRSATSKHDQGRHELVRFSPFDEERARRFFPYGPDGYRGRSWIKTTDWLAEIAAPINDPGLKGVKYPEDESWRKTRQRVLVNSQ